MVPVMTSMAGLDEGDTVECHGTDVGMTCAGVSGAVSTDFTKVLTAMQAVHPGIQRQNLTIEYRHSGIGEMNQPGGVKPVVTVGLQHMTHTMLLPGLVPGLPAELPLPGLSASQIGVGFRAP
jgi:hypothetical protein